MSMELVDAIIAIGFAAPRTITWDGKIHRFPTDLNRPHSKDGWYVAHDDSRGRAAAFGSMRDAQKHVWSNGTGRKLTSAELKEIDEQREKAKREAIAAKAATALRAQRIYAQASESGSSEYLDKKRIPLPDGCKLVANLDAQAFGFKPEKQWLITGMIIPMQNADGKIVNLQIIANGSDKKFFMPQSTTSGAYHLIGGIPTHTVVVAEGIATAQAILPRSHCPVAVAFSANNLPAVARIMRAKFPNADIIMAADGDPAGRDYAQKAIAGLPGQCRIIPAPDGTDFWDTPFPDLAPSCSRAELMDKLIKKITDDGGEGKVLPRIHNYLEIFRHAEEFQGLRYNEFADCCTLDGVALTDSTITSLQAQIEKDWVPDKVSFSDIDRAARRAAESRTYHPVREYLLDLRWDGIERIDAFCQDHLGTQDSPYFRGASRCLFIGAVKRIIQPGCQMDSMVVLESPQGIGKSKLWETLAGEWYLDQTASIESVDFFIAMRGKWFIDLGELDQFQRAEITRVKQVITLRNDDYRAKYARSNERWPRQSIFVGGTNNHDWITDSTGGRRFLPIMMGAQTVDIPRLAAARDQLFAEAVHRLQSNDWPGWWNVAGASEQQEARQHMDLWEAPIAQWLDSNPTDFVFGHEIFSAVLNKPLGNISRADETKLGRVMIRLGWIKRRVRQGKTLLNAYFPPT